MKIKTHPNKDILLEKMVVYQIENDITKDAYVGFTTVCLKKRYYNHNVAHSNCLSSNCNNRTSLYLDFKEYGKENFTISILQKCKTKKELLSKEKEYQIQKKYVKYNRRSLNRDTTRGKNKDKIIKLTDINNNILLFARAIDVSREFNVHKSTVSKAIKGEYRFLRKYKAEYINK